MCSSDLIELDGEKIKNQSGILQEGTLIDNLLPGKYVLNVELKGYSSWQKNVEVQSGSVSVFDSVILIPDAEPLLLEDFLADRVVSAGKHLSVEGGGGVSLDDTLVFGHEIVALSDSGTLLTKSTATNNYYLVNAFKPDENLNLTLAFNNLKSEKLGLPGAVDIKKALPYPYNDRRFVVATDQALYVLDIDKLSIEQIALGVNDFFTQGQNGIAWIQDQQIKTFNLPLRAETVALDLSTLDVAEIPLRELRNTSAGWLLLDINGKLTLLNQEMDRSAIDVFVDNFALSPDEESIAILGNRSVFIYNLATKERLDIGARGFINDFAWFKDSAHIFLLRNESLILADISDTGLENAVTLDEGVNSFSYADDSTVTFSDGLGIWSKAIID